jgi:rare lipoprotein A (peptidoglycan hydrolase)
VKITNTANQKSVTAIVADACPTCANKQSIDMSVGAFTQIALEATGQINIAWSFA